MTREHANRALVSAMRKRGAAAVAKAAGLLLKAHRTRTPAATGDLALRSEEDAYAVQAEVFAALWPGARPAA